MTISHLNGGFEIDHGDADLSSNTRDGMIDLDIGEDYQGGDYARYLSFPLSVEEAKALRDYLTEAIERLARKAGLEQAALYVVAIDGQQHPEDMAASIRNLADSPEGGAADGT